MQSTTTDTTREGGSQQPSVMLKDLLFKSMEIVQNSKQDSKRLLELMGQLDLEPLQLENVQLHNEIRALRQENEEAQQQMQLISAQLESLLATNAQLQQECHRLRASLEENQGKDTESQPHSSIQMEDSAPQSNSEMEDILQQLWSICTTQEQKRLVSTLQRAVAVHRARRVEMDKESKRLHQDIAALKLRIRHLEQQGEDLAKQCSDYAGVVQSLRSQLASLKQQNQRLLESPVFQHQADGVVNARQIPAHSSEAAVDKEWANLESKLQLPEALSSQPQDSAQLIPLFKSHIVTLQKILRQVLLEHHHLSSNWYAVFKASRAIPTEDQSLEDLRAQLDYAMDTIELLIAEKDTIITEKEQLELKLIKLQQFVRESESTHQQTLPTMLIQLDDGS